MVGLIPRFIVNDFNIDTLERAIIFGTLALQTAIAQSQNDTLRRKIKLRIAPKGRDRVEVNIDASLPFDMGEFVKYGGDFLAGIANFDLPPWVILTSEDFAIRDIEPTVENPFILPDSIFLNSFEQYLYYHTAILFDSLENNRNEIVRVEPKFENFSGSELRLKINLPLEIKSLTGNLNLLNSVGRVTTDLITLEDVDFSSQTNFLDNGLLLDNSLLLKNGTKAIETNDLNNSYLLANNTLLTN